MYATGESWHALEELTEEAPLSGQKLRELAESAHQVIDGVCSGYEAGSDAPWVVVEAVDSSFYAVHSSDDAVLDLIRGRFHAVTERADPVF